MRFFIFLILVLALAAAVFIPYDQGISHFIRTSTAVQNNEALAEWMGVFKVFGKGNVLFLLALAVGCCGLKRRAVEMVMALLLSALLVWPLKLTVQRERPNESNHQSFPSADAAAVSAAAVPLAAWSFRLFPAAGVVALSVAASRVFYGAHYPADVCAGLALGVLAGLLAGRLYRRWRWAPGWRGFFYVTCFFYLGYILVGRLNLEGDLSGEPVAGFFRLFGPVLLLILGARFIPVFFRKYSGVTSGKKSEMMTVHESKI